MLWLALLLAAPVRVNFVRTVRPVHDLNAERVAVVYAIGDHAKVVSFIDHFVEYAGRAGTIHMENAVESNQHLGALSGARLSALRKEHPADAYIGVTLFTCAGAERQGEVGDTNSAGERVRTRVRWLDAVCSAKLDVRAANGRQIATFMTHGEGTSPRVATLGPDEREIAYEQAARFAAIDAAESIVPRAIRESIELDERAPAFDEAVAMVNADRLEDARAIWEASLARHRSSAPLHFDLGAICEALGDLESAERYYRTAASIAPSESRYRNELQQFRKRNPALSRSASANRR